jgi:hypothetical protein
MASTMRWRINASPKSGARCVPDQRSLWIDDVFSEGGAARLASESNIFDPVSSSIYSFVKLLE